MVMMFLYLVVMIIALSASGSTDNVLAPAPAPPKIGTMRHGKLPASVHDGSSPEHSSTKAFHPHHSHQSLRPSSIALAPEHSSKLKQDSASSPISAFHKRHHLPHNHHHSDKAAKKYSSAAPEPSYSTPMPNYAPQGQILSPMSWESPTLAPAPSATIPSSHFNTDPPSSSPIGSLFKKKKSNPPPSVLALPPPPPNKDCASVTCTEPLTYTPPDSPCACVWPIKVKLRLGITIYTFFPLVSELAEEIATSISLNHSQVRIMGADAASQQHGTSTVLIDLVPRGVKFSDDTAFSVYKKFWQRQIFIKDSVFGAYDVVYVNYPGLPPSPPSALATSSIDDGPFTGQENNGQAMKPFGVDVPRRKREGLSRIAIAIIVLSSFTALLLFGGIAWLLLLQYGACTHQRNPGSHLGTSSPAKPSEFGRSTADRSMSGSASLSLSSGTTTYTGSAKTFTLNDMERATNNFDASGKIGEGGFGVVYKGILDDGTEVAVKVLKRDDLHGGREFLAEIEMLSRLHHRNLVKLIGICTEDHVRCLVYELVPNGSVESHLHGVDKGAAPLDWCARMKIALGSARGLAYLHEDSNPRVIHRDFKSSNILLEHDFTPKVSDFGLARTAIDEGHRHISTHVMGTFGYLAPEYAMTGHLLVKSDVYSYGVVLLELLTGRKPVDLSQPQGQENLVAYARPLLTSREGLEAVIDQAITSSASFDSIIKVSAIASMCVQPEVSHRPFMGEVVQALKLVCNEFEETREPEARGQSHGDEEVSSSVDSKIRTLSGELMELSETSNLMPDYDFNHDTNVGLSEILMSASVGHEEPDSSSFRRYFSSGPLRTGRKKHFWQRLKSLSRGSMSEHGFSLKLWPGS